MPKDITVGSAYDKQYGKKKKKEKMRTAIMTEEDRAKKPKTMSKGGNNIKIKPKTKSGKKTIYSKALSAKEKRDKAIAMAMKD